MRKPETADTAKSRLRRWGFGMAPMKPETLTTRVEACELVLTVLGAASLPEPQKPSLNALSIVKGLFKRVVTQDQWDWFTVSRQLGYRSWRIAQVIANEIYSLRRSIMEQHRNAFEGAQANLGRLPARLCLSVFLGRSKIAEEPGAGWIYLLSTREQNELLKVGMTTRTVEERVQEINRPTGVAIPFGVRRCWRVSDPAKAERLVHETLVEFRLRDDREFFKAPFSVAAKMLDVAIHESGLEIRTLDALTALSEVARLPTDRSSVRASGLQH